MHSYHNRTYRTERRRLWPRVLGWLLALVPWAILIGLWLGCGNAEISCWK